MIDVHAHLCFPDFDRDRDAVVRECERSMTAVMVSSARFDEGLCALKLAEAHSRLHVTLGYHPTEGGSDPGSIMGLIRANSGRIAAIGEVGLDYHWEKDPAKREAQKAVFSGFIRLAQELKKPIVIHSWDAERECFEMAKDSGLTAVFHCFSGSVELAEEIVAQGFYVSVSTQVLFSRGIRKLAKAVPLESMLLETDAPFLSPYKYLEAKGELGLLGGWDPKRNYPWNIALSARKIAEMRGIGQEEVLRQTVINAKKAFRFV